MSKPEFSNPVLAVNPKVIQIMFDTTLKLILQATCTEDKIMSSLDGITRGAVMVI